MVTPTQGTGLIKYICLLNVFFFAIFMGQGHSWLVMLFQTLAFKGTPAAQIVILTQIHFDVKENQQPLLS